MKKMKSKTKPPEVGATVWICICEHWYPKAYYPEFANARCAHAPAPARAEVKRLDFFEKGSRLKPTVVCVSHLRGNPNNMHYIHWPFGLGKYLFWTREECIKRCEELADMHDTSFWGDPDFDGPMLRPWRNRDEII